MEPTIPTIPVTPARSNKFKPVAIIFIILSVLLAGAAGFFAWKSFDQKTQIDDLNSKMDKVQTELDGYKNPTTDSTDGNTNTDVSKNPDVVTLEELEAAYKAEGNKIGSKTNGTVLSLNDGQLIKNSSIAPWQTYEATSDYRDNGESIGSGYVLFYREGPNGEWKYGFGGNGSPSCSEELFYSHPNIAKAFADLDCTDPSSTENTTFKEYYKNFGWW